MAARLLPFLTKLLENLLQQSPQRAFKELWDVGATGVAVPLRKRLYGACRSLQRGFLSQSEVREVCATSLLVSLRWQNHFVSGEVPQNTSTL